MATACDGGSRAPAPVATPPAATSVSAPTPTPVRPPAELILTAAQVGLTLTAARDHLGYLQAASEERDQATALELFQTFDWIDSSSRTFGVGSRRLDVRVIRSLRTAGARSAFEYFATLARAAPLLATACPSLAGLDQCAEGRAGPSGSLAGRRGVIVFVVSATGIDVEGPAARQAAALTEP